MPGGAFHFPALLSVLVALLLAACSVGAAQSPSTQLDTTTAPTAIAASRATAPPAIAPPATATIAPSATPTPMPVPVPRVGIQVGHWQLEDLPDEMQQFRTWSGSYVPGYDEWEINLPIAERVQQRLTAAGVQVDLLPTVIPIGYQADAFVSIHADGASGAKAAIRRGWKLATPYRASPASQALAAAVRESYGRVTGLPEDPRGLSVDMRAYYAFAHYRYWHSLAPTTPAIIIETGFMTYDAEWELLHKQPDVVAQGIAEGVLAYLDARDPHDATATQPVDLPMLKPNAAGVPLRRSASATSAIVQTMPREQRLVPLAERDGWYLVLTRGEWELGWVQRAQVLALDEPQVPPQPRPKE